MRVLRLLTRPAVIRARWRTIQSGFVLAAMCTGAFAPAFATALSASVEGELPAVRLPKTLTGTLGNGVALSIAKRPGEAVAVMTLSFRAGEANEAPDGRGAAWLAMQVLANAKGIDSAALAKSGATSRLDVGVEHMDLRITLAHGDVGKIGRALADAVKGLSIDDAAVGTARAAQAKSRTEGDALTRASALAYETAFERRSVLRGDSARFLDSCSAAAVSRFAREYLRSANAALCLVTSGDPGSSFNELSDVFGTWQRSPQPAVEAIVEPLSRAPRVGRGTAAEPAAAWLFRALDRDDPDFAAAVVLSERLRHELPGTNVELRSSMIGAGALVVARAGAGAASLEADLTAYSKRLEQPDGGATTAAIASLAEGYARELAAPGGLARRIAHDLLDLGDPRAFEIEYAAITAVTASDVARVARRILSLGAANIAQVTPAPSSPPIASPALRFEHDWPSGARVVLERVEGSGNLSIALVIATGSGFETAETRGAAAVFAEALGEILRKEDAGAVEVSTGRDRILVGCDVPSARVARTLTALASALVDPQFAAPVLDAAKARAGHGTATAAEKVVDPILSVASGEAPGVRGPVTATDDWTKVGMPAVAQFMQANVAGSRVAFGLVGDSEEATVKSALSALERGGNAIASFPTPPLLSGLRIGVSDGKDAVVARVFTVDPHRAPTVRRIADALAERTDLAEEFVAAESADTKLLTQLGIRFVPVANSGFLVFHARVAADDARAADRGLDAVLDGLANRGIADPDLERARNAEKLAQVSDIAEPRARARARAEAKFGATSTPSAEEATTALRATLGVTATRVLLWPDKRPLDSAFVIGPPAELPTPSIPRAFASEDPLAKLVASYGPNLLEPNREVLGPGKDAPQVDMVDRWYGDPPFGLNGLTCNDANVVDSLCEYVTSNFAIRHGADYSTWAPAIADYANWSVDKKTVTVHLRDDIRWQRPAIDPKDEAHRWLLELYDREKPRLTAHDVVFTHALIMDPGLGVGGLRGAYEGSTCRALDDHTFQLTFTDPNPYTLGLCLAWQSILPRFVYTRDENGQAIPREELGVRVRDHWFNSKMCGYGPYEFTRYEPDEMIVVRRMDDFPVRYPAVAEIRWHIIRDTEQVVNRMKAGELDFITLGPQQYQREVVEAKDGSDFKNGRFRTLPYTKSEYFYFGWNERKPLFADKQVRRALAHAVNRKAFVDRAYFGFGDLVDNHMSREHPFYDPANTPIEFDLEEASRLLDEAGFLDSDDDGRRDKMIDGKKVDFAFELITFAGSPESDILGAIFKEDLKKIGVDLTVSPLAWSPDYRERVFNKRDFDAYFGIWSTAYDVDFRYQFHSSGITDGSNYVGYTNPEMDRLSEEFMRVFEPGERKKVAHRIQALVREDQPYCFLMRRERFVAYSGWLDNVKFSPFRPQLMSFDWTRAPSK